MVFCVIAQNNRNQNGSISPHLDWLLSSPRSPKPAKELLQLFLEMMITLKDLLKQEIFSN
jgi:hypothetical protein